MDLATSDAPATIAAFLTAKQVANLLAISIGALDRAILLGRFLRPDLVLNKRVRRWNRQRLEKWLTEGSPDPGSWRG